MSYKFLRRSARHLSRWPFYIIPSPKSPSQECPRIPETRVIPYRIPLVPDNVPSNNASRSTVPRDHIRLIYNDRRASELYFSPITLEVFIITRYAAPCVYHVNFTRPSSLTTVNNDRALIASERAQITSPTNLSSGARRFHRNSAAIIKIPVYIRHTIRQRRRREGEPISRSSRFESIPTDE